MGLDESAITFVGRTLKVTPIYGWGWDGNPEAPAPPAPFHLRLQRLWFMLGERRGGVGRIEERGHPYDGKWVVFSTRHQGTFNFTTSPGPHNISIAAAEPMDNDDGRPVVKRRDDDAGGYAEIIAANDARKS
jgi:hypothetical protein